MKYNGSEKHINNLNKARNNLLNDIKEKNKHQACEFCSRKFLYWNVEKHQNSCSKNPKFKSECENCGILFQPKCNRNISRTCSHSCSNKLFRSGLDAGNWNYNGYRSNCFLFHEKKCVICEEFNIVEVHHLDEDRDNNHPSNLVPLCPTHHQYWHSKHKNLVEEDILFYLNRWKKENKKNETLIRFNKEYYKHQLKVSNRRDKQGADVDCKSTALRGSGVRFSDDGPIKEGKPEAGSGTDC